MAMAMWGVERLYVAVMHEQPPSEEEWSRWIELSRQRIGKDQRVLVETLGGGSGPNAKQRKALADAMQNEDVRVAVFTDSVLVRGIVTALAWLGVAQEAFRPGDYARAAAYLDLTDAELQRALAEMPRLRREAELSARTHAAS